MMKVILFFGSVLLFAGHIQASLKIIPELYKLYELESAPLKLDCVYEFPSSEGDGEPVAFYKGNEMIAASNILGFNVTEKRKIAGLTTTVTMSLMKDKTVQNDRGVYECKLGGVGTTNTVITVEIFSVVGMNGTLVKDAKTATLGCDVIGVDIGVDLKMTWKHKDKALTNGDKYQINATSGTLEIKDPVREDMGAYYCELTFDPTEDISHQVTPREVVLLAGPMIDKSDNTKNMVQGDELELKCKVSGYPAPTIKWLKDDMPVNKTNRIHFLEYEGNLMGKIQIYALEFEDEAVYTCFAFNEVSPFNATAEMQVRVKDKLAALWPFLGIVAEVIVLCTIILCYERRRSKKLNDEDDAADNNVDNTVDHKDVRHRRT